jgi:hypothetical protein
VIAAIDASFLLGGLLALVMVAGFILAVLVGLSVVLGLWKLRRRGGPNAARSLDERVGQERFARFLGPEAPRGPTDQLRARNS